MIQDEIIAANKKTAHDDEHDWAKEVRRAEVGAEERFGYKRARPRWNGEEQPGEAVNEVIRSNAEAVEAENRRYDEQNN